MSKYPPGDIRNLATIDVTDIADAEGNLREALAGIGGIAATLGHFAEAGAATPGYLSAWLLEHYRKAQEAFVTIGDVLHEDEEEREVTA